MEQRISGLVDPIAQPEQLVSSASDNRLFVDVHLGDSDEREQEFRKYREQHIFGAVYAQIRDVFASPPGEMSGNLPLPSLEVLGQYLRNWNVDSETEIILYGPTLALAARGWWVLRWAGLRNVKVLDGGLQAWADAGGAVAQGVSVPKLRTNGHWPALVAGAMQSVSVEEVENLADGVIVIDARPEPSYKSGCIPGATNVPASDLWTPSTKLRTTAEIRRLYEAVGMRSDANVIVYCGGGVLSALEVLTLETLGIQARLFVGSWSEWIKSADRRSVAEVRGEQ